ncbi:hypothetical protein OHB14_36685 [Streptomyces sp. NBC_01613]|uniref:hypothetical protein n=1 Tax=Streptomyces sp. NBC_01613 TaxID=2975896 RepID=UPI0038632D2E
MTDHPQDEDAPPFWERPRDGMGRFQRTMESVRRDARAAELLAQHRTYQQIADELGYYDKKEAWWGVKRAKADVARPAITKLIATESEELDALYAEACAILQRSHVTVSHGKVIMWRNPDTGEDEPLEDDGPKLAAIRVALDVRKAYQDLHGLKQPAKIDATIHEVTQQDLELQEMIREAKAAVSAEEQQIRDGGDA